MRPIAFVKNIIFGKVPMHPFSLSSKSYWERLAIQSSGTSTRVTPRTCLSTNIRDYIRMLVLILSSCVAIQFASWRSLVLQYLPPLPMRKVDMSSINAGANLQPKTCDGNARQDMHKVMGKVVPPSFEPNHSWYHNRADFRQCRC